MPAPTTTTPAPREESTVVPTCGSFGPFEIEGLIRQGGMGIVYRARQARLGRTIALKVLPPELAHNDDFRERFMREAQSAASLRHPNIVTVHDAGEVEGLLYIAMDFIDGPDLSHVLREEGPLAPDPTLAVIRDVGGALDAAHSHGLIHRDVKPANVLVAPDRYYLTDFGLTKAVSETTGVTGPGQFVGTVHYVAPEQIRGEPLDARTDVYGLGCLLYRCLAGTVPFQRDDDWGVLQAHLHEQPPRLSARRPDLPPALDDVVFQALAKSKDNRFPTCTALVDAVAHALGGGAVEPFVEELPQAALPAAAAPAQPRRGRHAAALVAVAAGFGLAALLALPGSGHETVLSHTQSVAGTSAQDPTPTKKPRHPRRDDGTRRRPNGSLLSQASTDGTATGTAGTHTYRPPVTKPGSRKTAPRDMQTVTGTTPKTTPTTTPTGSQTEPTTTPTDTDTGTGTTPTGTGTGTGPTTRPLH
ncbi:MAG: serine/threonine-protein kinase [Thermoleophilaceae bacterium]